MSKWTKFRDRFTQSFMDAIAAIKARYDDHPEPSGQALGAALQAHATEVTKAVDHMAPVVDTHTDRIAALEAHAVHQLAAKHPDNADEESLVLSIFGSDRATWSSSEIKKMALAVKLTGKSDMTGLIEAERVMAKYGWKPAPSAYNPANFDLAHLRAAAGGAGPGVSPVVPSAGGGWLSMSGATDQAPGPSAGVTGGFIDPYGNAGDGKPGARHGGAPNQIEYQLEQKRYWSGQPKYSGYWDGTLKDKNGVVIDYSKPGPRAGE